MSNLPKVVTIIALGVVGAMSAGYYALTGTKGSDGKIVLATGGQSHYQELGAAYEKALEPYGVDVQLRPAVEGFKTLKGLVAEPPEFCDDRWRQGTALPGVWTDEHSEPCFAWPTGKWLSLSKPGCSG